MSLLKRIRMNRLREREKEREKEARMKEAWRQLSKHFELHVTFFLSSHDIVGPHAYLVQKMTITLVDVEHEDDAKRHIRPCRKTISTAPRTIIKGEFTSGI